MIKSVYFILIMFVLFGCVYKEDQKIIETNKQNYISEIGNIKINMCSEFINYDNLGPAQECNYIKDGKFHTFRCLLGGCYEY